MSWQSYIDNLLTDLDGRKVLEKAAILGYDDSTKSYSVWASANMNMTVDEIAGLCCSKKEREGFYTQSPFVSGIKCRLLKDELEVPDMHCMMMKTAKDDAGHTYNVTIGKSKLTYVIGFGFKEAQAGDVTTKVHNMVKYLTSVQF